MVIGCTQQFRKQVKDRFNGGFAAFEPVKEGLLGSKTMIGGCVAALLPLGGWGQQEDPFRRPGSDPHGFAVGIVAHHCLGIEGEQGFFFLFEHLAFGDAGGLDLDQFRKTRAITGQMHTVAIDPAVIAPFPPPPLLILFAHVFRPPTDQTVGLMPNRPTGFEKAGIFDQDSAIEFPTQGFSPPTDKGNKRLDGRTEGFIASRERDAMGNVLEAKWNRFRQVLPEPTMLGFEGGDPPDTHHRKEDDQDLIRILKRMSTMDRFASRLLEIIKQSKVDPDIVGSGRCLHGSPPDNLMDYQYGEPSIRLCQPPLCTPLIKFSHENCLYIRPIAEPCLSGSSRTA